jgi:predicted Zn-dependent protease
MRRAARLAALFGVLAATTFAQEDPKPGFNLFSVEQDIEIGRQSAAEAERQLPLVRDAAVERYLGRVVRRLADEAPGARYPYVVRAVDSDEINAFALPGGFLYAHRGLVQATRSEGELAGVLAHEIAHVALRHGTHQASKAYAAQAGLGILGGLLGRDGGTDRQVLEAIGGLGLNAVFLKFGRDAENDADLAGARLMKRAGYDPADMAGFFDVLNREQRRQPGKVEQFFSSHPAPADRSARIRSEAARLGAVERPREVGGYEEAKAALDRRTTDPRRASRQSPAPDTGARGGRPRVEPPSSQVRSFRQRDGFFSVDYPGNWLVHEAPRGYGVVIAPQGGILDSRGRTEVVYGVVINHYDPFEGNGGTLENATDDLVGQVRRTGPHLRPAGRSERTRTVDGARARSVALAGRNPETGLQEDVTVVTRELTDGHVLYALLVAPREGSAALQPVFARMLDSLRVNDRMAHR